MSICIASDRWYALQIRSRSEELAAGLLESRGYEVFLPLRAPVRGGGAKLRAPRALFPGYLFCRLGGNVLGPVVSTPGVIRIVSYGNQPVEVDDCEIRNLRQIVEAAPDPRPCAFLQPGKRVRLVRGPLAGVEGVIREVDRKHHLISSISVLQRSVVVRLDPDWIGEECGAQAMSTA
jgi:transcription antitermination factor NusG